MMNRLTLSVLLLASLGSQRALSAGLDGLREDEETELLLGNERLFVGFCEESRAFVLSERGQVARESPDTDQLLSLFFGAASGLSEDVLNVERDAIVELAQLLGPSEDEDSDESPMAENKIAQQIEQAKLAIQRVQKAQRAKRTEDDLTAHPATASASVALLSVLDSRLFVKLAQARSMLSASTLLEGIEGACERIASYERVLEENLVAYKDKVGSEQSGNEVFKFLRGVAISNIRCQTTRNVVRLNAFCELFDNSRPAFVKMLALGAAKTE